MEWIFNIIKFVFKVVFTFIFSLTGFYWFAAGYKKQIGTFHVLCFVVASAVFLFPNPVSGVAILICIILGIISIIVYNSSK